MMFHHGAVRDPERLTARVFDSATVRSGCRLETYRDGDTYFIDIDLPGVDPADIDVTADRAMLTIRASRRREGLRLVTSERQVPLSDTLDTDRLEAAYENGQLTLRIPIVESREKDLPAAA
ncbi:MAG TPA: Hsp20/alpha crystallin family protein [Actinoplanes sp.]|nr:Hsp20/alpha crystallin family protein [Actinoplanes sp.]